MTVTSQLASHAVTKNMDLTTSPMMAREVILAGHERVVVDAAAVLGHASHMLVYRRDSQWHLRAIIDRQLAIQMATDPAKSVPGAVMIDIDAWRRAHGARR